LVTGIASKGDPYRRWVALRYNTLVSDYQQQIELLRLLASRLERLSADSHWARRASGLRGNIIKIIELADTGEPIPASRLDLLTGKAFDILRRAAEDIPDLENLYKK
jgi:hypothetical protein